MVVYRDGPWQRLPDKFRIAVPGIIPHIVRLYGRPGVGKLTIAEYLTAETGYSLLHNHAVVDLATSLFPFGSPTFVSLREKIWLVTFAPEKTVTDGFIPSLQKRVNTGGGVMHLVELRDVEAYQ